uniref:QWRF motif-containing protein 3 n=1 Tax=Leersia perrieri TaxID=77586 RepID=A0A0D9VVW6_9ORYZ
MSSSSSKRWTSAPTAALSPVRPTARRQSPVSRPEPVTRTLVWPSSNTSTKSSARKASPSPSPLSTAPPSSSVQATTLADHLIRDSRSRDGALSRQRSCTDADAEARKVAKSTVNGGRHAATTVGRSMRFVPSTRPAGVTLTPGRVAPSDLRRALDADVASSGSECSDAASKQLKPAPLIARTNSTRLLGSSNTQWALSPGRRSGSGSPLMEATVPELKGKRSLMGGLGWGHLFSRRKAAADTAETPLTRSGGGGNREIGRHQMRMAHCRLLQWRFANAKAEAVNHKKLSVCEVEFMGTWARMSELQGKVARKRVLVEKEKLKIKLGSILSSQMRNLESWGQLENRHAAALASTIGCTQAAVCKLPLINGAKVSLPSVATILQQAHDTTLLISELLTVVREEHDLLQECIELLGRVSALQVDLKLICYLKLIRR